jgi:hypothetical protein
VLRAGPMGKYTYNTLEQAHNDGAVTLAYGCGVSHASSPFKRLLLHTCPLLDHLFFTAIPSATAITHRRRSARLSPDVFANSTLSDFPRLPFSRDIVGVDIACSRTACYPSLGSGSSSTRSRARTGSSRTTRSSRTRPSAATAASQFPSRCALPSSARGDARRLTRRRAGEAVLPVHELARRARGEGDERAAGLVISPRDAGRCLAKSERVCMRLI